MSTGSMSQTGDTQHAAELRWTGVPAAGQIWHRKLAVQTVDTSGAAALAGSGSRRAALLLMAATLSWLRRCSVKLRGGLALCCGGRA